MLRRRLAQQKSWRRVVAHYRQPLLYQKMSDQDRVAYTETELLTKSTKEDVSPELRKMTMDFITQAKEAARSMSEGTVDDYVDYIEEVGTEADVEKVLSQIETIGGEGAFDQKYEVLNIRDYKDYLEDFLDYGPNLDNLSDFTLRELLMDNPLLGAIPVSDLSAETLLRGGQLDIYDYLQAATRQTIQQTAYSWFKNPSDPQETHLLASDAGSATVVIKKKPN